MIDSIANSLELNVSQNAQTAELEQTKKIEKTEKAEAAAETAKSERARETAPRKNDRVEFSSEARDYLAAEKSENVSAKSEVTAKDTAGESAYAVNVSARETAAEPTVSADKNISSSELYSYTENELLDLVLNGDISRSDYNTELAKREED